MTDKISFSSHLDWVNVADPANVPPDVRVITADDLLRYERFGDAATTAVNSLIDGAADHETRIAQNKTALDNNTQTLTSHTQALTTQGKSISDNAAAIGTLSTALAPLTAVSGPRVQASKGYDLTVAGGAKAIATIKGGTNYTSFEVEITLIGRTSAGPALVKAKRYIRPESGNPQYVTIGTDTTAGTITLTFAPSGLDGVTVSATATGNDAFVTAHITALAGGGAASAAARTVAVAMA